MQKTDFLSKYYLDKETNTSIDKVIDDNAERRYVWLDRNYDFEDYIDLICCEKVLEKYHRYFKDFLFAQDYYVFQEYELREEKKRLQNRIKKINMKLKCYQ